ncbi:aminomethyl-transferring glycine dehydrogenase subunit GcvPB [Candidatus Sumerlaeota bacterium]|nr:aminomethyl-transferring glycine dehydrogenase subunit GcvPB [Candidatus Sumerlaeota bacterium]
MKSTAPSIFERSVPGRRAWLPPAPQFDTSRALDAIPESMRRAEPPALPEVSQLDMVRHFNTLAARNMGIDTTFYPLGSCTMKLNPWINETMATWPAFTALHPAAMDDARDCALLRVLHDLSQWLAALAGFDAVTLQPAAGAHGELTALMMIQKMLCERGETERRTVLIPDTAHGTNPASAARCGFRVKAVKSGDDGLVDLDSLRGLVGPDTAALMITNPNTLGLFEKNIEEICRIVHGAGGQVYLDGANFNAVVGVTRPGDWGADVMHINLHKTFSTPHGGGGPGAGPVCVKGHLEPYLPKPVIAERGGEIVFDHDRPHSIGKIHGWHGNVAVAVRAWAYIRSLGGEGLRRVAQMAVLNANYLRAKVAEFLPIPHGKPCMHEFVASGKPLRAHGVKTLDLAKALIDEGFHPPTIYFPLVVDEALMIEPTESESRETLDAFADTLRALCERATTDPDSITSAPQRAPVTRVDEATAARVPCLCWLPPESE